MKGYENMFNKSDVNHWSHKDAGPILGAGFFRIIYWSFGCYLLLLLISDFMRIFIFIDFILTPLVSPKSTFFRRYFFFRRFFQYPPPPCLRWNGDCYVKRSKIFALKSWDGKIWGRDALISYIIAGIGPHTSIFTYMKTININQM